MAGSGGGKDRPGRVSAKAQRQEAARQAKRKQAMRQRAFIALGVLLVAAVVVVVFADRAGDRRAEERLAAALTAGECTVDSRNDSGREHVPSTSYEVDPPAGGDHTAEAANPGIYTAGQVPADGPLVHALEHGFVILWYRPGIDQETIDQLEQVGERFSGSTLVVPRQSLQTPVAATAWHKRLLCEAFEEEPLVEFIKGYQDKGPETGFVSDGSAN